MPCLRYRESADNDALAAAKAACDGGNGDPKACGEQTRLEQKDSQQQEAYVECRANGYSGSGCLTVLSDVVASLSSYAGTISYWASQKDQQAAKQLLEGSGGADQILKILAPNGVENLTAEQKRDLPAIYGLLVTDPAGVLGIPSMVQQASNGDPAAMAQIVALATKLKIFGTSTLGEIAKTSEAASNSKSNVWSLNPIDRGNSIESSLAQTDYSSANGWFRIGAERNGYFPLIDFQNGNTVVSLKTVDTTGSTWMARMKNSIDQLDDTPITVDGTLATKVLDVRVQPGGADAARDLVRYGASKGITVIVKEFQ